MTLKKLVALALVGGMLAGGVTSAEGAKRKKKKIVKFVPGESTFYISHTPESTCGTAGAVFLSTTATQGASSCGHLFYGAIREVLIRAGQEGALDALGLSPKPTTYPATDGVPFLIDASKEIKGQVVVKSRSASAQGQAVAAGVGQSELVVSLTGTAEGEPVTIAETTVQYLVQPNSTPTVEFTLQPDEALTKTQFSSLELTLSNRGASVAHGFYSTAGDSFFALPTLTKKVIRK
jgi:hypothetical protein